MRKKVLDTTKSYGEKRTKEKEPQNRAANVRGVLRNVRRERWNRGGSVESGNRCDVAKKEVRKAGRCARDHCIEE